MLISMTLLACQAAEPNSTIAIQPVLQPKPEPLQPEPEPEVQTSAPVQSIEPPKNSDFSAFQFRFQTDFSQDDQIGTIGQLDVQIESAAGSVINHFSPLTRELKSGFFLGSETLITGQAYMLSLVLSHQKDACLWINRYQYAIPKLPDASGLPLHIDFSEKPSQTEKNCDPQAGKVDAMGLSSEDRVAIYYIIKAHASAINTKKEYAFIKTYHPDAEIAQQLDSIYLSLVEAQVHLDITSQKIVAYDAGSSQAEVQVKRKLTLAYSGEEREQESRYSVRKDGNFWKIFEIIDLTPAENYVPDASN